MRTWPRHTDGHSLARNQRSKHNLKTRASSIKIGRREEKREKREQTETNRDTHERRAGSGRSGHPAPYAPCLLRSVARLSGGKGRIAFGFTQSTATLLPQNAQLPPLPLRVVRNKFSRGPPIGTRECTLVRAGSVQLRTAPPSHALLH